MYLGDEIIHFYFTVQKNAIDRSFCIAFNNSTGRSFAEDFPLASNELNSFKMIIEIDGKFMEMFPDKNMKITRKLEPETVKYFLNVYNRDICEIKENASNNKYKIRFEPIGNPKYPVIVLYLITCYMYVGDDFVQPQEYIYDAELNDEIIVKFDMKSFDTGLRRVEHIRIPMGQLKEHLSKVILKKFFKIKTLVWNSETGTHEIKEKIISTFPHSYSDAFNFLSTVTIRNEQNIEHTEFVPERIKTFIWVETDLPPSVSGTQEALKGPMTKTGDLQSNLLQKYLKNASKICTISNKIYAPFTSFIQSSGFGKSKVCLDVLKKYPGIYMVFRKSTDTGLPKMLPWMSEFAKYVGEAKKDDMPTDMEADANEYVSGRFLIALLTVIKAYKSIFRERYESNKAKIIVEPNDLESGEEKLILYDQTVEEIGAMFQDKPSENNCTNFKLSFNNQGFTKISDLTVNISNEISSFFSTYKPVTDAGPFPFLIFLDEADVFNDANNTDRLGRLDSIHIIRRGLHLLDHTTMIMVMAIGTNSDAIDFSPAVRDNSLRYTNRRNLLSPLILSGNWDIFSLQEGNEYTKLKFTRNVLCDMALFNVLVSFGRALWSSCLLKDVISIAMAKLQNGDIDCLGSRLALLLVRANFTVNVHHILARNLIKSYMVIVSYVSSDATQMKIGYSSEPVLAMASRRLLSDKKVRESILLHCN